MSKILKQDILTGIKKNLNETNIEDFLIEVKTKTLINFNVKLIEKGYKLFESFITFFLEKDFKICGFGRNKYEALSNAFINMIELLIEKDEYIDSIKDCLKILSSNYKDNIPQVNLSKIQTEDINYSNNNNEKYNNGEKNNSKENKNKDILGNKSNQKFRRSTNNSQSNPTSRPAEIIKNDNEESETKALVCMLMNDKKSIICHEGEFSIYGYYQSIFDTEEFISFKNEYQEKTLIIGELEKMVIEMMNQIKRISEIFEFEADNYPDYFKCPISWEKLENPVVSMEGHSYEKWAIDKWFINQELSPITGLILDYFTIISNYALKSAIDDYNKKVVKWKKIKIELSKYLTKSEYDLNDLKKYFGCKI